MGVLSCPVAQTNSHLHVTAARKKCAAARLHHPVRLDLIIRNRPSGELRARKRREPHSQQCTQRIGAKARANILQAVSAQRACRKGAGGKVHIRASCGPLTKLDLRQKNSKGTSNPHIISDCAAEPRTKAQDAAVATFPRRANS